YCPEIEQPVLADIMRWVPPGFGPFESYEADHTLAGGERLNLAGMDIEVIYTPGHSPGHLTYAISPSPESGGAAAAAGAHHAGAGARHEPVSFRAALGQPGDGGGPRAGVAALSAPKIKAPRGTFDVLGEQAETRALLETRARSMLEDAGYERIETPVFEAT